MGSVNKAILLGRLGADPELRYTGSGSPVCNFRIATTTRKGEQEWTEWHRITVWGSQGENCAQYLTKGREVYIEGQIRTREWEDKEGVKRYTVEIHAGRVVFLSNGQPEQGMAQSPRSDGDETDVPF